MPSPEPAPPPPSGEGQEVVVVCSQSGEGQPDEVATRLRALGMSIAEGGVHAALGMITGTIAPGRIDEIRSVPGVEFVRPSQTYRAL